jgi:hypothetical protein
MKAIIESKLGVQTIESEKILMRVEENAVVLTVLDGANAGTHVFSLYSVVSVSVKSV